MKKCIYLLCIFTAFTNLQSSEYTQQRSAPEEVENTLKLENNNIYININNDSKNLTHNQYTIPFQQQHPKIYKLLKNIGIFAGTSIGMNVVLYGSIISLSFITAGVPLIATLSGIAFTASGAALTYFSQHYLWKNKSFSMPERILLTVLPVGLFLFL